MKTYIYNSAGRERLIKLCQRPSTDGGIIEAKIKEIFRNVEKDGDKAVIAYTKKFEKIIIADFAVNEDQINLQASKLQTTVRQAIDQAYANISVFHRMQLASIKSMEVMTQPGVRCWREPRAIEKIGIYVPGGSAPLFSTVLMLGIPAQLAGCKKVVLCTPAQSDGLINPAICYAAKLVGLTKIFSIGGAQAVAALCNGTATVPQVDKIFGPGNQYVTAAKQYAERYGVAMDMPAGPSEVMVVADGTARTDFVAADLLSQAEHGPDSQTVLITTEASISRAVKIELRRQLKTLPRLEIAKQALKNSYCLVVDDIAQAVAFVNQYAPEHLILNVSGAESIAKKVHNAGSVFLGNYTPESAGDYASGTNHTLPTNGWSRTYSGLSVESFCKYITFQSMTKAGSKKLGPTVMAMAEAEGLIAHKRAMELRI